MTKPLNKTGSSTESPIKVMQIASGDLWAGAEVQLFILCQQLQLNPAVQLQVVLLNDGELAERLRNVGVAVAVYDESELSFWKILLAVVKRCQQTRPDIIHSHRQKENVVTGLCGLWCRIPSIRSAHGASEFDFSRFSIGYLIAKLDQIIGRWLQRFVVAVSEDLRHKLLDQYPEEHLALVRNGVSPSPDSAVAPVVLDTGKIHIGIVGRLVQVKRVDLFLQTAAELLALNGADHYQFWVIGDGPLRKQYETQAGELGIANSVAFVGHVPTAIPYLKSLDLLVMCSDHEGTPMTLLEALQCQLPIVAHDVGGLHELLGGGDCGRLVQQHTASGYAQAIAEVLRAPELRARYAAQGLKKLADQYSADQNMQGYLALYRQCIER